MRQRTGIHRRRTGTARRLAALVFALSLAAAVSGAQEAPFNTTLVGNFDAPGQLYADVWGDGHHGYIAHFGQRVVDIIDLSDPAKPVLAATYDSGLTTASAQDVKVGDGLMFVGMEGVSTGCHIVDVRDPSMPVKLTDVTVLAGVHNVFYDQGWLYLVDSNQTLIEIVDLTDYDPDDPPAEISSSQWQITGVGGLFVHDITVQNGRLYASAWDSLRVYDVSEVATEEPTFLGSAPGANVHAAWPTDDGRFVVVTSESGYSGMTLYEVSLDKGPGVTLTPRDYYYLSSLRAGSVHNVLIDGLRVYVSWYGAGVQVFEIDPEAASWTLVASYDTNPADGDDSAFAGCWGVYPYLGPDQVLASDRDFGLFILDVDPNLLRFKYPGGLPRWVTPDVPTPIEIEVPAVGAPADPGTVFRHAIVDGGPVSDEMLTDQGGDLYAGTLPAASCGSVIELSFSAENTLGMAFEDPAAPAEDYRVDVVTGISFAFTDDFELDKGWTVESAGVSAGAWVRGDPVGTGAQPEFDATGAVDGACFFTGQGPVGGSLSSADLDGGPTILTSPAMNLSIDGGLVTYAYWLFNNDEDDELIVEISNDGLDWVEARRYEALQGGWRRDSFHTSDFLPPGDQTQVRFVVSDSPNNSITEAAIDDFNVYRLSCAVPIFIDGFESGDVSAWSSSSP